MDNNEIIEKNADDLESSYRAFLIPQGKTHLYYDVNMLMHKAREDERQSTAKGIVEMLKPFSTKLGQGFSNEEREGIAVAIRLIERKYTPKG